MLQNSFGTIFSSLDAALSWRRLSTALIGVVAVILGGGLLAGVGAAIGGAVSVLFFGAAALAMWVIAAIFSGALAHISWQQTAHQQAVAVRAAIQFGVQNIVKLLLSPLALVLVVPVVIIAELIIVLLGRIPFLGELWAAVVFFPLIVVNILLLVGLIVGLWLIYPIIAEGERGVMQIIGRIIALVRHAPAALLGTYLLASVMVSIAMLIFSFLLTSAYTQTTTIMGIGLDGKWGDIARSSSFGMLLSPTAFLQIDSLFDRFLFGGRFTAHPFTYRIAAFVMGLGTAAMFACALLAFPWSFMQTISAELYHTLRDSVSADAETLPALNLAGLKALQTNNAEANPKTISCLNCGEAIAVNSKFCMHCGSGAVVESADIETESVSNADES